MHKNTTELLLSYSLSHCADVIYAIAGASMTAAEAMSSARKDQKRWGQRPQIVADNNDEFMSLCADPVTGKLIVCRHLYLVDSYDEAYLRAMGIDLKSTLTPLSVCCNWSLDLFHFTCIISRRTRLRTAGDRAFVTTAPRQ